MFKLKKNIVIKMDTIVIHTYEFYVSKIGTVTSSTWLSNFLRDKRFNYSVYGNLPLNASAVGAKRPCKLLL